MIVPTYHLTTHVDPPGGGTVTPSGGDYPEGTEVTITATPAEGYEFNRWSGDASGTSVSVVVVMDSDKDVMAHFSPLVVLGAKAWTIVSGPLPPLPPNADFSYSVRGMIVTFTDLSTTPNEEIVDWTWHFGDGQTSKERNPWHEYAQFGTYAVILEVTDNAGQSDSVTEEVTLKPVTRTSLVYMSLAAVPLGGGLAWMAYRRWKSRHT